MLVAVAQDARAFNHVNQQLRDEHGATLQQDHDIAVEPEPEPEAAAKPDPQPEPDA